MENVHNDLQMIVIINNRRVMTGFENSQMSQDSEFSLESSSGLEEWFYVMLLFSLIFWWLSFVLTVSTDLKHWAAC